LQFARSPEEFVASLNGRIEALARTHALLTRSSWQGADLTALIREQVLVEGADHTRITCAGPEIVLHPQVALHLALVLHELGTNARAHGALSVPHGRLTVSWAAEAADTRVLHLRWVEVDGPQVRAPTGRGFGTLLIGQSLTPFGGESRMLSEADGVTWEISLPLRESSAEAARMPDSARPAKPGSVELSGQRGKAHKAEPGSAVAGRQILVVEDEPLLALDITASLTEAGVEVVGPAATVEQAIGLIERTPCDGALLDANLNGEPVEKVATALTRRGIPFVFVTGYGRESLPPAFRSVPIIAKPCSAGELIGAVRRFA
jgi:two-component sensor histidine kinase